LLVGREDLAVRLGISAPTLDRWDKTDILGPAGISPQAGGRKLWSLADVKAWVAAGMPSRREWKARQTSVQK
jgi:hypothetical protein